jgi:hypothetical protein
VRNVWKRVFHEPFIDVGQPDGCMLPAITVSGIQRGDLCLFMDSTNACRRHAHPKVYTHIIRPSVKHCQNKGAVVTWIVARSVVRCGNQVCLLSTVHCPLPSKPIPRARALTAIRPVLDVFQREMLREHPLHLFGRDADVAKTDQMPTFFGGTRAERV